MECKWKDCTEILESDLIHHVSTHIDTQTEYTCLWHGCKKYGEKQSSKYALQAHVRKHTNDRPYGCTKCTKQYTRSDALNKHSKNHARLEEEINDLSYRLESVRVRRDALQIKYNYVVEMGDVLVEDVKVMTEKVLEVYCNRNK